MSDLKAYLIQKREALADRVARIERGELGEQPLKAAVSVEGRSGIRRIRIRDFQVLTDSPPDFAGYNLGPSSPELQLGVLGSCLAHSYLIQAAALDVPIESIDVEVDGVLDARAARPGFENVPVHPRKLAYVVHIASSASSEQIAALEAAVDRSCPILNLLRRPQEVSGEVRLIESELVGDSRADARTRAAAAQ